MRLAVLADIHGNVPALEAVLADVARCGADAVVVAGDVVPGPQPSEVLRLVRAIAGEVRFVRGNGDREVVEAFDTGRAFDPAEEDPARLTAAWTAERIGRDERDFLAAFEPTVALPGVLVCHATPAGDLPILTSLTPDDVVARALAGVTADVVVCGHTHVQYEREVGGRRLVNAGSVGMPYEGRRGAYWTLIGPDGTVEPRRADYDVEAAAETIRASGFPDAANLVDEILLAPPDPEETERFFETVAAERGERWS